MKKTLLIFFFLILFSFSEVIAQPTLLASNTEPNAGDNFSLYSADSVFAGDAGANITWDFGGIFITGGPTTQSYVLPSATAYGASYPSSNLATSDANGNTEYFATSSSSWVVNGAGSGQGNTYFNGLTLLTFPFTYTNTVTNSSVTGSFAGFAIITGNTSTTADGFGTLILPGLTFNNVLRVKFTEFFDYKFDQGGDQLYNFTTYYWYDGIHNFPLFELTSFNSSGVSGITHGSSALVTTLTTGIHEVPDALIPLNISPDPAQGETSISYSLPKAGNAEISVYDISGRALYHSYTNNLPGENKETIDLSGFAAGIYIAEINSNGYTGRRKFVVK